MCCGALHSLSALWPWIPKAVDVLFFFSFFCPFFFFNFFCNPAVLSFVPPLPSRVLHAGPRGGTCARQPRWLSPLSCSQPLCSAAWPAKKKTPKQTNSKSLRGPETSPRAAPSPVPVPPHGCSGGASFLPGTALGSAGAVRGVGTAEPRTGQPSPPLRTAVPHEPGALRVHSRARSQQRPRAGSPPRRGRLAPSPRVCARRGGAGLAGLSFPLQRLCCFVPATRSACSCLAEPGRLTPFLSAEAVVTRIRGLCLAVLLSAGLCCCIDVGVLCASLQFVIFCLS